MGEGGWVLSPLGLTHAWRTAGVCRRLEAMASSKAGGGLSMGERKVGKLGSSYGVAIRARWTRSTYLSFDLKWVEET